MKLKQDSNIGIGLLYIPEVNATDEDDNCYFIVPKTNHPR
jgi:hypothetical protein